MSEPVAWEKIPDRMRRQLLFTPCETKEALANWLRQFLGLDLPDTIIDPSSNSCPLDLVWEIYRHARVGDNENFSRILAYAARECFKTLVLAVMEILCAFHLHRSVVHLAAIEQQSMKAQSYVKTFLSRPLLRDYVGLDNVRNKGVVHYHNPETGDRLSAKEYAKIADADARAKYVEVAVPITVVVATLQSVNGQHSGLVCVDGKSEVLVEVSGRVGNRRRERRGVRGVFRKVAGLEPTGRIPMDYEGDLDVTAPAADVSIMGYDWATGAPKMCKITAAYRRRADTLRIDFADGKHLICTPDHPLYVMGASFLEARDLAVGMEVLSLGKGKAVLSAKIKTKGSTSPTTKADEYADQDEWEQVVLGSLLGDCGIYQRPGNNPYLSENHAVEQAAYLEWKRQIVARRLRTRPNNTVRSGFTGRGEVGYYSGNSPLLLPYKDLRTKMEGPLDRLGPLGLAVWYMDDGCAGGGARFSTEGFTVEQNVKLAELLWSRFAIRVSVRSYERDGKTYHYLGGDVAAKRRLVEVCSPHVHPDLAYKFDLSAHRYACRFCGEDFWFYEQGPSVTCDRPVCRALQSRKMTRSRVISIQSAGERDVYDFTVDGNNFFANSLLNKNCVDELDVIQNPRVYEESKMIPTVENGRLPLTLLTSTRKFAFGIVQKEIDKASKTGLEIRHWNLIDSTARCEPERHRPDLPMVDVYVNNHDLSVASPEEYAQVDPDKQAKYEKDRAFAGCLSNCKMFAHCRGRLTKQKAKVKGAKVASMLKPIAHTQNTIGNNSIEMVKAQLLCWKPSLEGMIFPFLNAEVHLVSAAQIAKMLTGEEHPDIDKAGLIALFRERDARFVAGMDFGYSHNFAVALAAIDGARAFVLDGLCQAELELEQQIELCDRRIKHYGAKIFADPENPQNIKTFKRKGYRIEPVDKGHGSVLGGIEIVRGLIRSGTGMARLFFLADDPMVKEIFDNLSKYHWKVDAAGNPSDVPDDKDDDLADALRYLLMSVFGKSGKITVAKDDQVVPGAPAGPLSPTTPLPQGTWIRHVVAGLTGDAGAVNGGEKTGRKGGLVWSFGDND